MINTLSGWAPLPAPHCSLVSIVPESWSRTPRVSQDRLLPKLAQSLEPRQQMRPDLPPLLQLAVVFSRC